MGNVCCLLGYVVDDGMMVDGRCSWVGRREGYMHIVWVAGELSWAGRRGVRRGFRDRGYSVDGGALHSEEETAMGRSNAPLLPCESSQFTPSVFCNPLLLYVSPSVM